MKIKKVFSVMKGKYRKYSVIFILFILIAAYYIPLPYSLEIPGTVEKLSSRVTVEGGQKLETGSLNLTTVYSLHTNMYLFIYHFFTPDALLEKQADEKDGQMDTDDMNNQFEMKRMMDDSKTDATVSAFKAANIPVDPMNKGVFISALLPNSKAKGKLQAGDIIQSLDGFKTYTYSDAITYLNNFKHNGDDVSVSFLRNGKIKQTKVKVSQLTPKTRKVGLGIVPDNEIEAKTPEKVIIKTDDINGPSAGLMISLEIYDQLKKEDLTKGYKISGTGTIDLDGNVGQIGEIQQKIAAAHKARVDIFFCPKDLQKGDNNEKEVIDEAKKRGYNLRIVPVKSLEEAIMYLEKLSPKK
jgi:PDZ domain-containing protein